MSMSSRVAASDGSRPSSRAALLPSSDQRLNHKHAASPKSSPSSHDVFAMDNLLKAPVVVKPHPTTLSVKPRSLQPLMLLPRQHLQLSFLDLAAPSGSFQFSRFYDAKVKILELEARLGADPKILVARLDSDKTVYALERQETGLYTLCKLSSGVDLDLLSQDASLVASAILKKRQLAKIEDFQSSPAETTLSHHETKKRRLAIEAIQSLVKKPIRLVPIDQSPTVTGDLQPPSETQASESVPTTLTDSGVPTLDTVQSGIAVGTNGGATSAPDSSAQPDADNIFDSIRRQYQEALYHSRASKAVIMRIRLMANMQHRDRWRTLQKDLCQERELRSISTAKPIWTWWTWSNT